ncbi:MAG TPA: helix-turn-helix transcriptional regulator [Gemmatimonadales bacterium]|nr:helix-turn-helix transcriptional regulator [Gemmatimonadales bacterium]
MKLFEGSSDEAAGRDPVTRRLLELLYRSRKAKGWTVRDLAAAAGISPSYVSLIENGHKIPDAGTIERLGQALELDPALLRAWVTVRSRTPDATESIQAAQELMQRLEILDTSDAAEGWAEDLSSVKERDRVAYSTAPSMMLPLNLAEPEPRGRYVRIPMVEEGTTPLEPAGDRSYSPLIMDRRALPDREQLRGAFAWRLSWAGVARIPGVYRSGDMIVIAPEAWEPRIERFHPLMVFAVRSAEAVVLSRVSWTGTQLVLHGSHKAAVEVIEDATAKRLRDLIVGRVIAAVQRFRA